MHRVGRNAAILLATGVFCKVGSLAVWPFILRAFAVAEYGMYVAAFAYAGLLGMVACFGMNQIVVRDISRGERSRGSVILHCTVLRAALMVPAGGLLLVIGIAKGFSPLMWFLSLSAFAVMALDAVTGAIRASMQAGGRFGGVARVDAVRKSSQWVIALAIIATGASIAVLAGGVVVAAIMALCAAWFFELERGDFAGVSFESGYARRMLALAAPMGVSAAFVAALSHVDIWLLDWMALKEDVALYQAASVFKPVFLAQAVVWAFMPLAFRLAKENREKLLDAAGQAGRFLMIAAAATGIFFVCGAPRIVALLAGDKYAASAPVFAVMGLTLPFLFVGFLYLHILTAVDKQILAVFIFAGGLAVNVAADVLLIPRYGPTGAMVGTLAAEIVMAAAALCVVWKVVGRPYDDATPRALAAVAAGICAAIVTNMLSVADMGISALVVMAVALAAFGGVTVRDLVRIKGVFRR